MKDDKHTAILKNAGIRPTPTRILIYKAIIGLEDTFSLGDLENILSDTDKSTIFRTLTLFNEHHLIHSTEDGSNSLKYCICRNQGECNEKEYHCHFYCEECKKTYCLENGVIPALSLPAGFIAHRINYIVKGVCAACINRKR